MNFLSLRTVQICLYQSVYSNILRASPESVNSIQARCYAARKGTRERRNKAKVKVEVKKVGFIPLNQRNKAKFLASRQKLKFDDSDKRDPVDDVFVCKYYKWIAYPFQEAVKCHQEVHHPEIYNRPEANLNVSIELNMEGEKKTRFLDNFTRIVAIPHKFDQEISRSVAAFSKTPENQQLALDAGAGLSGGVETIKKIQNGEIAMTDFKYVVAHPDILPELVVLRGLLKRKFPSPKNGSLDVDLKSAVDKFLYGITYTAVKDEYEKDFGLIKVVIGNLTMEPKQLEENFAALIRDVHSMRPKRQGTFISRCLLWTNYSSEKLKVNHNVYIEDDESTKKDTTEEEEDAERIAL
ncbi:39S ribosomal protein L1, mitochondrial [Diorhabda sublineata]|uniref:39S ribosomal protein L1, mitochondrial n=1 Tax=Diorhabda sublineata TaxID=1163346 RepID=UPI0024E0AA4D|nr:39S ribosomal protein L1, mitochondrial [Diorhabda sublineata]